jgi:hypothetical protein
MNISGKKGMESINKRKLSFICYITGQKACLERRMSMNQVYLRYTVYIRQGKPEIWVAGWQGREPYYVRIGIYMSGISWGENIDSVA